MFHTEEEIVWNLAYYYNPKYDQMIDEGFAITGTDRKKAEELYFQAQQIIVDDAPAIFMLDLMYLRAARASLKGVVDNPLYSQIVNWYDCYRE